MEQIKSLKEIAVSDDEEKFIESCYVIMKTFSYSLDQIEKMPLTTFKYLLKMMDKENKIQEREAKKARSRSR